MISNVLTKAGLVAVRIYRLAISPYHPPVCRYTPSCSEYAETALRRYGPFKGCWMSLCRIVRCNPFSAGGYDPVR